MSSFLSKAIRGVGKSLDRLGAAMETNPNFDGVTPCLRAMKFKGQVPSIDHSFVAPSAALLGRVKVGARSNVWNGAVIRGDVNNITIGSETTIGDRVMIHCSSHGGDHPTSIGDRVLVGAGSIIHGCVLENGAVVGEGAQVMDGAVVKEGAVVAPGSVVTAKKTIPANQLWAGVPARYVRDVTAAEKISFARNIAENQELAIVFAEEFAKDAETVSTEEGLYVDYRISFPRKVEVVKEEEDALPTDEGLYGHDVPGRVLDSKISAYNHVDPIIKERYERGTTY